MATIKHRCKSTNVVLLMVLPAVCHVPLVCLSADTWMHESVCYVCISSTPQQLVRMS